MKEVGNMKRKLEEKKLYDMAEQLVLMGVSSDISVRTIPPILKRLWNKNTSELSAALRKMEEVGILKEYGGANEVKTYYLSDVSIQKQVEKSC